MRRLLILCNVMDERLRIARGIRTDSPAASRKMFMLARALRHAGVATTIISMGRGRDTGDRRWHRGVTYRSAGVPFAAAAFVDRPVISRPLSMIALAVVVARRRGRSTLLVYNRSLAYVPAMAVARLRGWRIVLDLEDGFPGAASRWRRGLALMAIAAFDRLCGGRALLACSALAAATRLRPTLPFYGISDVDGQRDYQRGERVTALLGGSVAPDTGGDLLADVICRLRVDRPAWATRLIVEITGSGASIPRLQQLADEGGFPAVTVRGRISDADYEMIRASTTVGLALKPNAGALAHTTFPSKVIEMAAADQVVITTDISDVRAVLGDDGALYLTDDDPASLAAALRWVVDNPAAATALAARGREAVARACDASAAGKRVASFLFPA